MHNFPYSYQHLPYNLDPVAFSVGSFRVDWYAVMYLVGFAVVYLLLYHRIKKGENVIANAETLLDLMLVVFVGLLIGGRLGYVLFYNLGYYWQNPLEIISPLDPVTHQFIGIYGMSYHGGLIGAILAGWIFIKRKKTNFWQWANFIAPAIPAGYFFGRLGNFLNGELYGRATGKIWGMYFPSDFFGLLRHPSQIYEAILEGAVLFAILWVIRNKSWAKDNMLAFYLMGYALARIGVEFFREPDEQVGYVLGFLTLGQILSLSLLIFGLGLFFISRKEKKVI